jgi:hypothetical protein
MKTNLLKILVITTLMIFFGAGVSLADGWKGDRGKHGHAYGRYKQKVYHHHYYAPPRPVYVERHYRPVVVERHYYPAPVYYATPAPPPPNGLFFGMSVADAGSAFSFGVGGR